MGINSELSRDEYLLHCLSAAYIDLLSKKDKNDIGARELAKKAGVSKSSFYRLFGNSNYREKLILFHLAFLFEKGEYKGNNASSSIKGFVDFFYKNKTTITPIIQQEEGYLLSFIVSLSEKEHTAFILPSLYPTLRNTILEHPEIDELEALKLLRKTLKEKL